MRPETNELCNDDAIDEALARRPRAEIILALSKALGAVEDADEVLRGTDDPVREYVFNAEDALRTAIKELKED